MSFQSTILPLLPFPGKFITLEGGEGSGKSTQGRWLEAALKAAGINTLLTREPGGSIHAENIRGLLLTDNSDPWDAFSEVLLLMAARREHLKQTIWPALQAGTWVICDRFQDSSTAYQGYGLGLSLEILDTLYNWIAGEFSPDITLIFDLPRPISLERLKARNAPTDPIEQRGDDFHMKVRDGYKTIAVQHPNRCKILDASLPQVEIAKAIWRLLEKAYPDEIRAEPPFYTLS